MKDKEYNYIYKTTCTVSGRWYIGMHSTNDLDDDYIGSGTRLWHSINKHGRENHVREILEFLPDRKSLAKREREFVNAETLKEESCMNMKEGGEGGYPLHASVKGGKVGGAIVGKMSKGYTHYLTEAEAIEWRAKAVLNAATPEAIEKRKATFVEREHQKGEKNSNFGKRNKCVSKDGVTKRVPLDSVEEYLQDGWVLGFKK